MIGTLISQAIARQLAHHNFYDAMLQQDGHELIKLKPPRDVESWQRLPISAIANIKPVIVNDLSEPALKELIAKHPYNRFPVVLNGQLKGIVTRKAIKAGLAQKKPPEFQPAVTCAPNQAIRRTANKMIESPSGMLLLVDPKSGSVTSLVTLHDLLRAQVSISE